MSSNIISSSQVTLGMIEFTRKYMLGFASIFNKITVARYDSDGNIRKYIRVPLVVATRDKKYSVLNYDAVNDITIQMTVPMMAVSINGFSYNPQRHLNKLHHIDLTHSSDQINKQYTPVPYDIDVGMQIKTRDLWDMLQIIEQIMPKFMPVFPLNLKVLPAQTEGDSILISLESISPTIETDMDEESIKYVTCDLAFNIPANYYNLPRIESSIKTIEVDYEAIKYDADTAAYTYTAGDTTTTVRESSYTWAGTTTSDATTEIFLTGAATTRLGVQENSVLAYDMQVIGLNKNANEIGNWRISGSIQRTTSVITLENYVKELLTKDDTTWDVTVEADDINNALIVKVTGNVGDDIGWKAKATITEYRF